ncbi:MAG TPA: CehA/McbA family metallohydrolase [Solimonas sp.]|nr:CehA/McbA family metallohydrolase [Solimonas sp.]
MIRQSLILASALVLAACGSGSSSTTPPPPSTPAANCAPGLPPLELGGSVGTADAKSYRELPFVVGAGTGRVELSYGWSEGSPLPSTPLTATTLDLGLWDQHGYRSAAGFRGWSGSRQGRIDQQKPPVFVEAAKADRGYVPGAIEPGTWHADLGIAAVGPGGADWTVKIECKAAAGGTPVDDPVDRTHVARRGAGWYHGDFHMHAYHSNPNAPDDAGFVEQARAAQLDFLMVTEYVTGQHWRTLGAMQRANPDLLVWPGREIITYYGHAMTHGETPGVLEYRHGFEDVSLGEIQRLAKQEGALFQINHPTSFPGPLFANFCRGCAFELEDAIDWHQVDTIELLNGPLIAQAGDLGVPLPLPVGIENPFIGTAIALWERKLGEGYRVTGVSGSDSKGVDAPEERTRKGYGSSATAVHAEELSRTALTQAIRAGHAYIRTRGVAASPALEFEARTTDGQQGMFGDSLQVDAGETVQLRTVVSGGSGQLLLYYRNGQPAGSAAITTDPFVHEMAVQRQPGSEGPLGTFWRIETRDAQARTTIGNPVFLRAR